MTLILTLCTKTYILQVSDRLVTRERARFDPASNKNVIFHARNGLLTIGYSGPAYMEDVPTDRWIAEKLRGQRFKDVRPGEPFHVMGQAPQWLDVGQSIELLRAECERAYTARSPQQRMPMYIVAAGWQWQEKRERRARPFLGEIYNLPDDQGASRIFKLEWLQRHWYLEPGYPAKLGWAPEAWIPRWSSLSEEELTTLMNHLLSMWLSPRNASGPLIEAIRRKARSSPLVGPDCMCINLPHPKLGFAQAVYVGESHHQAFVRTEAGKKVQYPNGYSPWIIGPDIVMPPSIVTGTSSHRLGAVDVSLIGPEHTPETGLQVISAISGQKRPSRPI